MRLIINVINMISSFMINVIGTIMIMILTDVIFVLVFISTVQMDISCYFIIIVWFSSNKLRIVITIVIIIF